MIRHRAVAFLAIFAGMAAPGVRGVEALEFDRVVIDDDFPGAYQVEIADVNGDKRPDVIAVGGGTCAWYENPRWTKRVVTSPKQSPGIISSATADLDGDGKAEIAIAYEFSMNEPARGKLLLAVQGKEIDDPWSVVPVTVSDPSGSRGEAATTPANLGSIHRLRWGWVVGKPAISPDSTAFSRKLELVIAPLFGPSARPPLFNQEPAHVRLVDTGDRPKAGRWTSRTIGDAPVLHAIDVVDDDGDGKARVLSASNLGVVEFRPEIVEGSPVFRPEVLATGAAGEAPRKGASEIHLGKLRNDRRFLATVEPWHGSDVAIYLADPSKPGKFGDRNLIDATLKEGHALWVADVDGDEDDEVFAGYRGPGTSVLMFDFNGKSWDRTVVDSEIAAQDLRGGDLDGDGRPDLVSVGGKTHNVIWYRPKHGKN